MLNTMQNDILKELVNVYIGQAASLLSEMVQQRIILKIPDVNLINIKDAESDYSIYSDLKDSTHVISSSIRFGYDFTGKAFLLFPAEQAKIIVNACIGEDVNVTDTKTAFSLADTDFDVLREISNVILNAIIGEFSNLLETKLEYSLPEIELVYVTESEYKLLTQTDSYILVLHTNFLLAETQVNGVVVIMLGMNSVTQLLEKIDEILGGLDE